jgi:predicted phosphoribosyltransferase
MTEAPSQPGESVERQEGLFRDRRDAGRALAERLEDYRDRIDVVVLALPRGGVPVAYEIATGLRAPLDVWPVRKLGAPGLEQLAMCAVAGDGLVVLDDDVVRGLGIPPEVIEAATEAQAREIPGWAEG